jgi:hypothetical protein
MYFRLEVTVFPLPFFLIYMAAWPAQAAGVRFFYTEEGSVPACVLVFFYTEEVSAVRFFLHRGGIGAYFFFTPRLVALPPAVDAIDPTPPSLSPRRRTSRRRLPFLRGDGSCSLVLAAALHRADGRGLPTEETDAAETSPSLWSRPCMIHHRRPSISRRRLSFPHPLQ